MTTLSGRISEEMKAALLSGDRFRGGVLRNLRAAILNEEVAQMKRDEGLSDAEVEKVITREAKKRQESAQLYRENGREDLAEPEENELAVLQDFLPKQLSEDEIREVVQSVVADMGEVSMQQMGQVIGGVKAKTGAAADGAVVARIVKDVLQTT